MNARGASFASSLISGQTVAACMQRVGLQSLRSSSPALVLTLMNPFLSDTYRCVVHLSFFNSSSHARPRPCCHSNPVSACRGGSCVGAEYVRQR